MDEDFFLLQDVIIVITLEGRFAFELFLSILPYLVLRYKNMHPVFKLRERERERIVHLMFLICRSNERGLNTNLDSYQETFKRD